MAGSRESSLEWKLLVQTGGQNPHEGVASACRVDRLDRIRRCYFASSRPDETQTHRVPPP